MKTITNTSTVTDYSGEPPIVTFSNPVTTVIRDPAPMPIITRIFYRISCNCCDFCCRCDCDCGCNYCYRNDFCC